MVRYVPILAASKDLTYRDMLVNFPTAAGTTFGIGRSAGYNNIKSGKPSRKLHRSQSQFPSPYLVTSRGLLLVEAVIGYPLTRVL